MVLGSGEWPVCLAVPFSRWSKGSWRGLGGGWYGPGGVLAERRAGSCRGPAWFRQGPTEPAECSRGQAAEMKPGAKYCRAPEAARRGFTGFHCRPGSGREREQVSPCRWFRGPGAEREQGNWAELQGADDGGRSGAVGLGTAGRPARLSRTSGKDEVYDARRGVAGLYRASRRPTGRHLPTR